MDSTNGFQVFEHGHQDVVQAADYNFYGNRLVTASSDHRLKVWDLHDGEWELTDTWRGHDAEIMDVKWNGPVMGQVLGSVGEDGKFKLWEEDVAEPPNSGRRFKCIYSHTSPTHVPYSSLDMKNQSLDTFVALISRDGHLTVYEPSDPDSLRNWQPLDSLQVCPNPSRGEETGFKVRFHKDPLPCFTAVMAGLGERSLSLVVGAMDTVKVLRTNRYNQFYTAAELKGHRSLVRDVSWARGSVRGSDIIATACKDGFVRIFELTTPSPTGRPLVSTDYVSPPRSASETANTSTPLRGGRNAPSGIGAGLAGALRANGGSRENDGDSSQVKHVVREVASLAAHQEGVWRVAFNMTGDMLATMGDDGRLKTWKRAITGEWVEYAEIGPEEMS
ncbi:putative nuclear pore protein [Xylona heveae TC161]|uniref:Putative nuclear pore protein n=1 Tax=Xylona heveae (strain CBS 132557 / TC161) TaxID=1328760 RepID=A0A165IVU5_XYLHT|nr:putative nuclear pore protein [Xylona heveae TC161]KZF25452.1 putative nuclear pore protein [Xylona heveae TC161]